MTTIDNRADAIFMPESMKRGRTQVERIRSVLSIAEPLLGVDRARGERGWIRKHEPNYLFIVRDHKDAAELKDTVYFPATAPGDLRGKPRYRWIDGPIPGVRLGYLTEAAREWTAPKFDPRTLGM